MVPVGQFIPITKICFSGVYLEVFILRDSQNIEPGNTAFLIPPMWAHQSAWLLILKILSHMQKHFIKKRSQEQIKKKRYVHVSVEVCEVT